MSIQTNIAKIYLNLDRTVKKVIDPFISRGANNTVQIMLVAPFNTQNSQYVNFELESSIEVPTRYMILIGAENSIDTNNEDWGVWVYSISEKILAGAAANVSEILNVSFSEFLNSVTPSQYEFIGFQSTEAALNANFPTPTDDQYAGVGNGTTLGTSICYLAVAGSWVSQGITVLQFESDNSILRQSFIGESNPEPLSVDPNISTINDEVDNTNLDIIFANISTLNGKVLTIETLLGVDGENFVKSDLAASYPSTSTPEGEDLMFMQKANGDKRRVSFADLAAGARDNFIGTFLTASGLTCPDPDDLLCVYPNGIADPNDRLGWVANVSATSSVWRWVTASNDWQDTGEAPSLAKDVGYDPASDASTNETNVQDAMVEHGNKIKTNEDDIVVVENKTQKLDISGNIAENITVLAGKDIASPDLSTGTSGTYLTIIQALIAEYGRNNAQDVLIADNATDILARLVGDFSTLINKSVPADGDLMALWDVTSSTNKNISWAEFKAAIDTSLINDQGWYANLAALQSAIPVGQNGWHATIGDVDTRAVWDSDSADWIEVASKLYYTVTEGGALEVRVGNNETAITAINVTLGNKENLVNKIDSIVGEETSVIKYLSAKGVFDYVNPQILVFQEVRKFNKAVQVGLIISRASTDTTLSDGRIDRVEIEGGVVQNPGIAQYSIDGGATLKNIAVYDVGSSSYVNLDLSISIVSGSYFTLIYSLALDKWLVIDSDVDVSMIRGAGWLPVMTTSGNYTLISALTLRVVNLEENQGVPALQEVAIDTPIIVTTNAIAHELVFDETTIPSNETDILDVDVNFNHVVKANTEPGLDFKFYAQIKNQGTPGSTADSTFYIANKSAPVTAGNFIIGKKYRINSVGTTDFTLIGASGNTIGIIFTATGVGVGTGSALIIFRDVRITAIGQDIENDRAIPFSISNDDYVAPFTPGLYYTNDGVNFNILQTILTCTTIFPSGNAPASSDTTILIDSATESRNGLETKQKGHNDESVVDRKNLLEAGNVIVAAYQSIGQYMANKTEIVLDTNKIVRVLFSGNGTDLTELVELSLDNGSTYYDVEYRETEVDLTVKNAVTHVMDLYFTGTKFIATYVDSPIENQSLPYVKLQGQFAIPKNDVPVHIGEEIAKVVEDYKGGTLEQIYQNGNFIDTTIWLTTGGVLTVLNSIGILTASGSSATSTLYQPVKKLNNGSKEFNRVRARVTNADCDLLRVRLYAGTLDIDILNPIQNKWYEFDLKGIVTGSASTEATAFKPIAIEHQYVDAATASGKVMEVDYAMGVPIDNTYIDGLTAAEISARITYFESLQSVGSPVIYVPADYDQWIQDMYAEQGVVAGDIIQGIFIESIGKNKVDLTKLVTGRIDTDGSIVDPTLSELLDVDLDTGYMEVKVLAATRGVITEFIPLDENTDIVVSITRVTGVAYIGRITFYDSNKVRISHSDSASTIVERALTSPSGTKYVRASIISSVETFEVNSFQLELETVKSDYARIIKANAHINEELGDVPDGSQDDFDFVKTKPYYLAEDDVVSMFTGDTNLDYARVILSNIDSNVPTDALSSVINGYTRIDSWVENIDFDDVSNIGKYYTTGANFDIWLGFTKGTSLAAAKTALAGAKIRYKLATPLPRDGILAPKLDMTGNIITGPGYTYIQSSTSGITNEFKATTAVNTKSQVKLNTDATIDLFKEDAKIKSAHDKLEVEVAANKVIAADDAQVVSDALQALKDTIEFDLTPQTETADMTVHSFRIEKIDNKVKLDIVFTGNTAAISGDVLAMRVPLAYYPAAQVTGLVGIGIAGTTLIETTIGTIETTGWWKFTVADAPTDGNIYLVQTEWEI